MTAVKFSSKYVPLFQKLTNVRTLDTQTIIDFIVVGFVVDIKSIGTKRHVLGRDNQCDIP